MNSIGESWRLFERFIIPKDAGEVQREEMRRAFYCGAESVLRINWNIGDKNMSEDAGIAILNGLRDECEAFAADMAARAKG